MFADKKRSLVGKRKDESRTSYTLAKHENKSASKQLRNRKQKQSIVKIKILLLLLSLPVLLKAQDVTLSGYLKDAANGEALIGATVYIPELHQGTVSNAYGFYSLTITTLIL